MRHKTIVNQGALVKTSTTQALLTTGKKMDMEGDMIEISPGVEWGTMAGGDGEE